MYLWKLNGGKLKAFPQKRLESRQECQLSPFQFDFALKILTNATQQIKERKGTHIGKEERKQYFLCVQKTCLCM